MHSVKPPFIEELAGILDQTIICLGGFTKRLYLNDVSLRIIALGSYLQHSEANEFTPLPDLPGEIFPATRIIISPPHKTGILLDYEIISTHDCIPELVIVFTVFISPKASYPRIASGSGCPASAPQPVMAEHGSDPFPNSYARADARLEKEMHSLRNLEALARCNKDPRCIRVAVMSNQHAFEYTEKVVDKIRSLSATVPPLEKSNAGEQSVKTLIMLTVDGAIMSMLTVKTSKNQKLDRWANRLLIRAAPFQPFDQHLSESADSIVMNVEFRFDGNKFIYVHSETNETRLNSELVHEQNNQERR